jgi:hypothetical protein
VTEPGFGVIVNWMLFSTAVLLAVRLSLLMNGVTPGVYPLILIVVSSAWLDPANGSKAMRRPVTITMDAKRFFINANFYGS